MAAERLAEVTWRGPLVDGAGLVSGVSSGVFRELPVSWNARSSPDAERTSPEELLAAAHATSFAMALAAELEGARVPARDPFQLDVSAVVRLGRTEGGWRVLTSHLAVRGDVSGLDGARFRALAERALQACPLSQALRGNVALHVEADLIDSRVGLQRPSRF
jgi:osmotically inducible protein OsmC